MKGLGLIQLKSSGSGVSGLLRTAKALCRGLRNIFRGL